MNTVNIRRLIWWALLACVGLIPDIPVHAQLPSVESCVKPILAAANVYSMDISPSGTRLAVLYLNSFGALRLLALADLESNEFETLDLRHIDPDSNQRLVSPVSIRWGEDDQHLLYLDNAGRQIKQIDIPLRQVKPVAECRMCESFATHRNGFTAVMRRTGQTEQTGLHRLEVSSPYGGLPGRAVVDNLPGGDITFSPDGRKVAYLHLDRQPGAVTQYAIRAIDLYSREVITTPYRSLYPPAWVSDTSILVADTESLMLWQYDLVARTRLLFGAFPTRNARDQWIAGTAYQPNGRYLVFFTRGAGLNVYIADLMCMAQAASR